MITLERIRALGDAWLTAEPQWLEFIQYRDGERCYDGVLRLRETAWGLDHGLITYDEAIALTAASSRQSLRLLIERLPYGLGLARSITVEGYRQAMEDVNALDSEASSFDEWCRGVDALLEEVRHRQ